MVIKGHGNRLSKEPGGGCFTDGQDFQVLESPVLASSNTGAGCTFASSIASQLLLGKVSSCSSIS